MTDLQLSWIALGAIIGLLALRVPVGVALGVVSFVGIWQIVGLGSAWSILSGIPYDFVAHWSLSSIPMFLLMGYVAFHAGLTDGLFRLARLLLGRLPGGLALASIGGAAAFSAVTGSSLACAAAMGRIAVPEMLKSGYDKGLSAGVVAAAGTIGSLIPPSILFLVYGIFAEVPISLLFIGGILPGLLTAIMYAVMVIGRVKLNPALAPTTHTEVKRGEMLSALLDTWPVIALVIGVFGGLYGGIFSPTEAGAAGAGMAFLVALAKRSLSWQKAWAAVVETLTSTAAIFLIAIGANLLVRFLALSGFTDFISTSVVDGGVSPMMVIAGMSAVLLFLGCFLDPIGILLLTLPLFLPVIEKLGFDLIWFGVILVKFLEIALITPPVGLNVFVINGIVGDTIRTEQIFKGVMWFIVADIITVTLLIVFPDIIMFLPNLLKQ